MNCGEGGSDQLAQAHRLPKVSTSIHFQLEVVIEADDGRVHAYCPELKGLHVDGATEAEALVNLREVAALHLASLLMHGDPVPVGTIRRTQLNPWANVWRAIKRAIFGPRRQVVIEDIRVSPA